MFKLFNAKILALSAKKIELISWGRHEKARTIKIGKHSIDC